VYAAPITARRLGDYGAGVLKIEHPRGPADPHRIGKRLLPPMDDRFSARRGTYRVIYRIDDKARVVTVVDVAHRRDIYRT
jgi:mRNA-degrading endonuclease RelE of RelBE toxin-antitoxin system